MTQYNFETRKVEFTALYIDFDADGAFKALTKNVASYALIPENWARLLRNAITDTILRKVRERYIHAMYNAVEMETQKSVKKRKRNHTLMARYQQAHDALTTAHLSGDLEGVERARKNIGRLNRALRRALNVSENGTEIAGSELSTGLYRVYLMKVLALMTDPSLVSQQVISQDMVRVGFGAHKLLDPIETPSATPKLTGKQTTSPYRTMWRQVEFGTGVYGKDPGAARKATRYQIGSTRMWAYSRNPPNGLVLRGTKGVHALRDQAGGNYPDDLKTFVDVFTAQLAKALGGSVTASGAKVASAPKGKIPGARRRPGGQKP